ncbi:patatin-like phospholipase domain-containing protein [Candidatus Nitrospira nitrosa]|uniref:patatin-like phospholipase family protein n=1 Tax=Candidatus Nitrospira nitrosa TaxID=1742972 RepID=UPI001146AFA6|nr:patatin-like phospholipase family protein [Candidatus Nitrospira nitrosa]
MRKADGSDDSTPHSIDLQMFSTNLSHGRPYIFPLEEKEELFFMEQEMIRCLPEEVVLWMIEKSPSDREIKSKKGLLALPPPNDFPVLLATRMSLSFPFLLTAIPLHCIVPGSAVKQPRRCWFSDGGISSNFPIHLFDDLLPRWPTFGLTLEPKVDGQPDVFIAKTYNEGYEERWNYLSDEVAQKKDAGTLGWFMGAIVGSMQNWNDNSLTRMPGVRDRVARVRLNKTEGGLNLNMDEHDIKAVAARGKNAIRQLLQKFSSVQNGSSVTGWDEHRFVRLHVLLKMLAARAPGVVSAVGLNSKSNIYATDFCKLLNDLKISMKQECPPGYTSQITSQNCADLVIFVQKLAQLAQEMEHLEKSIPFTPIPIPELRVRPPL